VADKLVVMRDFKYRALVPAPLPDWGFELSDFRSECLRPVADAFRWNLIRTSTFSLLPALIALDATREQLWLDHSAIKSGNTINPNLVEYRNTEISEQEASEFARLAMEYRSLPAHTHKRLLDEIGTEFVETSLEIPTQKSVPVSIQVFFSSIIMESWTGFECLLRDLWAAMLDNDTGPINGRVLSVIEKPRSRIRATFNIKTHPGSYQVQTLQVNFKNIKMIKKLFTAALGSDVNRMFVESEDNYIVVLNAFRNILTHKRGQPDQDFFAQLSEGNFPEFSNLPFGQEVLLRGDVVRKMRDSAVMLGRQLICLADAELQRQQKP
jgi:hypothetical protein